MPMDCAEYELKSQENFINCTMRSDTIRSLCLDLLVFAVYWSPAFWWITLHTHKTYLVVGSQCAAWRAFQFVVGLNVLADQPPPRLSVPARQAAVVPLNAISASAWGSISAYASAVR
jgi:hypothetical protein